MRVEDFPLESPFNQSTNPKRKIKNVDLRRLANLIVEPYELFAFCDSRYISSCWRFLFTSKNKYCPTCLDLGFHTRFFSLKLLKVCPIHNEPLLSDCSCMGIDGESVDLTALNAPHTCKCAKLTYFDPSKLHGNDHQRIDTSKLKPIADWLLSISQIQVSSYMRYVNDSDYELDWLLKLNQLSRLNGFQYPSELINFGDRYSRLVYKTKSIPLGNHEISISSEPLIKGNIGNWDSDPHTVVVYKSIARHIRHHIARRSEYWIEEFKRLATPEAIALLIRTNLNARLAFTELIWANCVEPSAVVRRWDNRKEYHTFDQRYRLHFSDVLRQEAYGMNELLPKRTENSIQNWARGHVFGTFCLAVWKQVEKAVENGININKPFWDAKQINLYRLFGTTISNITHKNSAEISVYLKEPLTLPKIAKQSKEQRVRQRQKLLDENRTKYENCCSGLCLTWSEREGWYTSEIAFLPASFKLHSVKINAEKKYLKAILFRTNEYFVLRLLDYKLQVCSPQTSKLFNFMRSCFSEYCKINGITFNSQVERESKATESHQYFKEILLAYEIQCIMSVNHYGFCKSASLIRLHATSLHNRINIYYGEETTLKFLKS